MLFVKNIEYYIKQSAPIQIRAIAERMMEYYCWDRPPYLLDNYKGTVKYTSFAVCRPQNVKPLPLVYRNTVLYSSDLFGYATELGDDIAPFWLGLMYEHGLSDKTPKNADKAADYYRLASERGCRYPQVFDYVARNGTYPHGFTDDSNEAFANILLHMIDYNDSSVLSSSEIGKIFDNGEVPIDIFQAALTLLCFYAEKGRFWSICSLANAIFKTADFRDGQTQFEDELKAEVRSGSTSESDAKELIRFRLDKLYLSYHMEIALHSVLTDLEHNTAAMRRYASKLASLYMNALRNHDKRAEGLREYYSYG